MGQDRKFDNYSARISAPTRVITSGRLRVTMRTMPTAIKDLQVSGASDETLPVHVTGSLAHRTLSVSLAPLVGAPRRVP